MHLVERYAQVNRGWISELNTYPLYETFAYQHKVPDSCCRPDKMDQWLNERRKAWAENKTVLCLATGRHYHLDKILGIFQLYNGMRFIASIEYFHPYVRSSRGES